MTQISPTAIAFIVIIALEVGVIIVGNVFTICVFWTQRFHLKRTYLLLINLAVADLFTAIAEILVLVTETIPNGENEAEKTSHSPSWALKVFGSSTSVFLLALISLERVFAVLKPLRHRVTNTQAYIYSIVVVWVAGLCMAGLSLLTAYKVVDTVYATFTYASFLLISLLVICVSYLTIRSRLHCKAPVLDVHRQTSREKNLRMSRTLFIVIAVSLVFWLPAFVILTIKDFCSNFFSLAVWIVTVLHLGNSMANPFVYSFRMPMFQDALKKFWRKRRQNIELTAVPVKVHSVAEKLEIYSTRL